MRNKHYLAIAAVLICGGLLLVWIAPSRGKSAAGSSHGEGEPKEAEEGPHGGRLLRDGDFAVEVTIFESGVPPEFRVYALQGERALDPAEVTLAVDLHRFGGKVDRFEFAKRDDYLVGDHTVEEPHSFEVKVTAERAGQKQHWEYDSYEGRTTMSAEAIKSAGITIETAGPAPIRTIVRANGRVVPNEDHLTRVIPRYPGVVKEVRKRLGQSVARGEVLAVVESNQALQPYEVKSAMAGTVIAKDVAPGEFAREGKAIYTVADLSTVWVDLNVYHQDFQRLRSGQKVTFETGEGIARADGTIIYLSPFGSENTQMLLARGEISNAGGDWRPGLFATGEIVVEEATVPVAVKTIALQTFRDWDVVFLNDGSVFQVAPLELGRRDKEWVEVASGLEPGQRYTANGSFVVKADVGKSGATHDH